MRQLERSNRTSNLILFAQLRTKNSFLSDLRVRQEDFMKKK